MKPLDPADINLLTLARLTEDEARAMLERLRWPNGPVCPHCGVIGDAKRMESSDETEHQLRDGVLNCRACRKPFTVTVGTIFEGSHIPLAKWLLGFYLFASSKKSLSALQLQRQLKLGSYRTAWHMAHRIRHAMQNDPNPAKLSGIVEADETYVGGKLRRVAGRPSKGDLDSAKRRSAAQYAAKAKRIPVAVLVSRDGKARARAMDKVTGPELKKFLAEKGPNGLSHSAGIEGQAATTRDTDAACSDEEAESRLWRWDRTRRDCADFLAPSRHPSAAVTGRNQVAAADVEPREEKPGSWLRPRPAQESRSSVTAVDTAQRHSHRARRSSGATYLKASLPLSLGASWQPIGVA